MEHQDRTYSSLKQIPQFSKLSEEMRFNVEVAASIIPFKSNTYIVEQLIDWEKIPNDPIFQMCFPQKGVVLHDDFEKVKELLKYSKASEELKGAVNTARKNLIATDTQNSFHIPNVKNKPVFGICHQFQDTILAFPFAGADCFAICTYCYRWMKHLGIGSYFGYSDEFSPVKYLHEHPEVSDIQMTGGDPMTMSAQTLAKNVLPLLLVESLDTIRFSTRALSWWPYRFTKDDDADALIRVLEAIVKSGKHCSIMAHITHPRELSTDAAVEAIKRIQSTGTVIRSQAPMMRNINDNVQIIQQLLKEEVKLGIVPYYLYLDADSGPREYFRVPFASAFKIIKDAQQNLSGFVRTLRGPVIQDSGNKILISDIIDFNTEKFFIFKYLHSTEPQKNGLSFFTSYNESATRLCHLQEFHRV